MLSKALQAAAGNGQITGSIAEAVDFDGTNDYLQNTSITPSFGSAATFSCWFYYSNVVDACRPLFLYDNAGDSSIEYRINTSYNGSQSLDCRVLNGAGNIRMAFYNANDEFGKWISNGWNNLIVSFSIASTLSVYLNDQPISMTIWGGNAGGSTTINSARLVRDKSGSTSGAMRLSNVFLDYTYRNLSIEANRRLFITADLKPALDQAALNPLIYLQMDDPTAVGTNAGTGGNFTLTGTVARSGRGPNQYNAQAAVFNGSTQYISRAAVGGSSKLLTMAFSVKDWTSTTWLVDCGVAASPQSIYVYGNAANFVVTVRNSSNTTVLDFQVVAPSSFTSTARWYNVVMSVDLSNTAKRFVYVNGGAATVTWNTYTNDNMDLSYGTTLKIGTRYDNANYFNGSLSAFYLNQSYIDLSVASNLAKFTTGTGIDATPVDLGATGELPTGTSPLIYLPMYGNNAGNNVGTGGDFTVSSGPFTGYRGPNEYWGNKAQASSSYMSNTGLTINSSTFTMSFWMKTLSTGTTGRAIQFAQAGASYLYVECTGTAHTYRVIHYNPSTGNTIQSNDFTTSAGAYIQFSKTGSTYTLYVNGVSVSFSGTSPGNITSDQVYLFATSTGSFNNMQLSEVYASTSYVNFSQETNRLLTRDCFGNPVNLTQQIEDAALPSPVIYMRFSPTSFGTNTGTGGNFTLSDPFIDGGQL